MLRRLFTPINVALLSGGLLFPSLRATELNNVTTTVATQPNGVGVHTEDINPFTHLARIPAGVDLSTIRFEKVRLVQVASRMQYTMDAGYCKELAFRDPGGSIACPYAKTEAPVRAYEVIYSFTGQPLASDEYAGRNFTFSVYFGMNELAPELQKALSGEKLSRSDAASYFAVSTYRETEMQLAIDDNQSRFCKGNYMDGVWTHTDAGCTDTISYKAITAPSGYITIRVDPASSRALRGVMASAKYGNR